MLKEKNYICSNTQLGMRGLLFSILTVVLLSFTASALDDNQVPFIAEQFRPYELQVSCDLNGYFCYSTTVCNVSVVYPNSSFAVNNKRMNTGTSFVNYTLSGNTLSALGRYMVDIKCNDPTSGLNGSTQALLLVTPTGSYENTGSNILFMAFAVLFSGGLLLFGFSNKDSWTVMFGSFLLTVVGLYVLLNGIGLYQNIVTQGIAIVVIFFSLYALIRSALEVVYENFS